MSATLNNPAQTLPLMSLDYLKGASLFPFLSMAGFHPGCVFGKGQYRIIKEVGSGTFGTIYKAVELKTGEEVAVKVESNAAKCPQLKDEKEVYDALEGGSGIAKIRLYEEGRHFPWKVLVMDLLGPSLERCFNKCHRHFTLKTIVMLADQMIRRLELMHSRGYIHQDIKPDNFLMGSEGDAKYKVFLIDFGLSMKYRESDGAHVEFQDELELIGTPRYSSLNTQLGLQQSRRDDLEALGNVFMYFLRGNLPWQHISGRNRKQFLENLSSFRMSITTESLCEGHPNEFLTYLNYVRNLRFDEMPDYLYLRFLFYQLMQKNNFLWDYEFDWNHRSRNNYNNNNKNGIISSSASSTLEVVRRNKIVQVQRKR